MGGIFDAIQNNGVQITEQARKELQETFTADAQIRNLKSLVETYHAAAEQEKANREAAETDFKYRLAQATNMFNRRTEIIKLDARKETEKLVADILEPVDDLERVLLYLADKLSAEELTGLSHVYKKIIAALRKNGCEQIDTAGEFNPNVHEAIAMAPGEEPNKIASVQQNGYTYKEKLVRPAKVVVSSTNKN